MSLEIKTHDVLPEEEQTLLNIMYTFGWTLKSRQRVSNRTTTPTGAFTYSGVTLIHSETETDEYTTLTFERETNISGYRRIVALEEEFWELLPHMTAKRPLEPPSKFSFEEWIKINKPRIISTGQRIKTMLLCFPFCFAAVLLLILSLIRGEYDQWIRNSDDMTIIFGMWPFGGAIPLSLLFSAIYTKIRSAAMLRNPNSKGYQKARNLYANYEYDYNQQLEAPKMYDFAQERVPRIIAESKRLLDEQ